MTFHSQEIINMKYKAKFSLVPKMLVRYTIRNMWTRGMCLRLCRKFKENVINPMPLSRQLKIQATFFSLISVPGIDSKTHPTFLNLKKKVLLTRRKINAIQIIQP